MPRRAKAPDKINAGNLGGIGAAIKARENKIEDMRLSLDQKRTALGRRVTPHMAAKFRLAIIENEKELAILYQRREEARARFEAAKATAHGAPSPAPAKISDWE